MTREIFRNDIPIDAVGKHSYSPRRCRQGRMLIASPDLFLSNRDRFLAERATTTASSKQEDTR
ncbi:hypothetical protein [Oceanibaculum indicum]|uniref:Uncharacterized protein n=1 Tax=Oceanibaculum indicum P24 TaxID=1207063 RepID=K2JIH9_9PROT|nr:hypothetical protein [Oceanibaculum indicum]EKE75053.1 hypothetical protein P24_11150 [Oceanibaculum indicum P24]